jgi:RNA polymerase-binding transcription factor DksA
MSPRRTADFSREGPAARVVAERRAIQARLAALDRSTPPWDREALGGDNTPAADFLEVVNAAVARPLDSVPRRVLVARLRALQRAEAKLGDGTYGRCEACGEPIPPARLRALPEATHCVPCAEREAAREPRDPALARPAGQRGERGAGGRASRPPVR